ncbi:MAG TPA: hypothetical protein VMT58_07325 [Candidatus Binataceae bacterium]|nr:hypothetical protein [Candidatus Binataceae bacterium]
MGAALIGLLFGIAGVPVWLLLLVIGWLWLRRFEQKLSKLEADADREQ